MFLQLIKKKRNKEHLADFDEKVLENQLKPNDELLQSIIITLHYFKTIVSLYFLLTNTIQNKLTNIPKFDGY